MNVFQSLVDELKDENLLEETVIETHSHEEEPEFETVDSTMPAETNEISFDLEPDTFEQENVEPPDEIQDADLYAQQKMDESLDVKEFADSADVVEEETASIPTEEESVVDSTQKKESSANYNPSPAPIENKVEFYRKRAMDEVSGLQMVEHVLSGVEREQMKIIPKSYDDLEVKKVLHRFLQVANDLNSPEHAQLEFQLMQETESWYSALSHRDKHISVAHLRRFCETTRPVLSSQALIALARFYRNSPFSEQVRSKFDLILTRLFAKDTGQEKRTLTFSREELITHLSALYADWASVPLYTANEDEESEILIIVLKFEDFMAEADNASNFDELIKNDFFNRLRVFKKSTNENFFAPLITATAIECNVRVGNRYVDLLKQEKEKLNESILEDKYGFLHDQAISEATGKTLQLVDLLKSEEEAEETSAKEAPKFEQEQQSSQKSAAGSTEKRKKAKKKKGLFSVNKWLLAATILTVVLSIGVVFWAKSIDAPPSSTVKTYNLENSFLKDYLVEARISNDTFFGFVNGSWNVLEKQKKEEVLKRIREIGREQGYSKVQLIDEKGQTAGFATEQKIETF